MSIQTKPQLFAFEQDDNLKGVRVITDSKNDIWFVANDICAVLDLRDVKQAIARLDEDERGGIMYPPLVVYRR